MMIRYQIHNWHQYYETAETRKLKNLLWVPTPNKHDGVGFRRIARHPRAVEIFCAWNLILQIASKCQARGVLEDDNGPLTATDCGDKTGFPDEIFEVAFEVLSDPKIRWIDKIPVEDGKQEILPKSPEKTHISAGKTGFSPAVPGENGISSGLNRREGKEGKEGNKRLKQPPATPPAEKIPSAQKPAQPVFLKSGQPQKDKPPAFVLHGQPISGAFWQKMVNYCGNAFDAGKVFWRAWVRSPNNIIAYIQAGLSPPDRYAFLPLAEESDNPEAVRDWIETNILKYRDQPHQIGEILKTAFTGAA